MHQCSARRVFLYVACVVAATKRTCTYTKGQRERLHALIYSCVCVCGRVCVCVCVCVVCVVLGFRAVQTYKSKLRQPVCGIGDWTRLQQPPNTRTRCAL